MKKLFQFLVIFMTYSQAYGSVDHFPTYTSYYCYEEFSLTMPSFGIYVNGFQDKDKISVYILDKSSNEYILRDSYECKTVTTEGTTYIYATSNIYQDYLKYGTKLEYKTVIYDHIGVGTTWTSSFIMNIDQYTTDISTTNIIQTCNNLSMGVSRNNGTIEYQWFFATTEGGEYTYLAGGSGYEVTQAGFYRVRLKPERCTKRYIDKTISVPNIYLNNLTSGAISNSATAPVCDNINLAINETTPATGGGTLGYSWYGSDDKSSWTNMYLTSGSISVIPRIVKQYIKRKVTSCNGVLSAESNIIEISKIPELSSGGTIIGNQQICNNTTPGKLTGSAASGGGVVTYSWQSSLDNISWSDIAGANQLDYSPGVLTKTTYFRRVASSSCGTIASNTVTVSVLAAFSAGTIASDQTICYNTFPNNLVGETPVGGFGNYSYTWYYSYDNTNWVNAGNTIRDYQPSALQKTTLFKRMVNDNCGSNYTNTVTITVNTELGSINISGDQSVCYGASINTLVGETPSGAGGTFTFKWQYSNDKVNWFDIPNTNSKDYQPTNVTQTTFFRRVTSTTSCGMANSNIVKVTMSSQLSEGTISGNQQVCEGTSPSLLSGTIVDGITYQWQSSSNGDSWENIAGGNNQNYNPDVMTSSRYFRRAVISGCGTKYSNNVYVTVYPKPTDPVVSGLKSLYCKGSNVNLSVDGSLSYNWYDGYGNLIKTGKTYELSQISEGRTISVKGTDSNNCKTNQVQEILSVDIVKAGFSVNATSIKTTEFVQFKSSSTNASSFLWDFSEGEKSTKENPIKYFYSSGQKTVKLTVTSPNSCRDSVTMQNLVIVTSTTGIEEIEGSGFKVYPNPFTSDLVIESEDPVSFTLNLIDQTGKVIVKREAMNLNKIVLNCESLPSGVYLVKIQKGRKVITQKIVKQ